MKTESVLLQNLCVPCRCHCRYCLLSWAGQPVGIPWKRSTAFALGLKEWLGENQPELRFDFAFGYSMEHPDLKNALRFLREIGSPQAEFFQCDGMRMRTAEECEALASLLAEAGVKHLNFTFYGLEPYHDRFAGRKGDFALLLRMIRAASEAGLSVSAGIPLTLENVDQAETLLRLLRESGCGRLVLFIPHEEGRGLSLAPIRLTEPALSALPGESLALLNRRVYRTERDWVTGQAFQPETRRSLLLSLRADNIDRYEAMDYGTLLAEAEALDDAYYAAFPSFPELAERYGDPESLLLYRQRDLFAHYRRLYAEEFGVSVYDVTDERQTGSRRT